MVIGPIPLFEPLMRPVKFVTGRGFLIITNQKDQYYFVGGQSSKLSLPPTEYGPLRVGSGSSAGGGVSLVAGHIYITGEQVYQSVIYSSKDDKVWRKSFMPDVSFRDGQMSQSKGGALVWKNGVFRHSFTRQTIFNIAPDLVEYETSSPDGVTWSPPSVLASVPVLETEGYRSPFPGKYCKHHNCIDVWDQNVPDGFMQQGSTFGEFVRPKTPPPFTYSNGLPGYYQGGVFEPSKVIEKATGTTPATTVTAPFDVYCVAAKGNTVVAGGIGAAASADGGMTWKAINTDFSLIMNITATGV